MLRKTCCLNMQLIACKQNISISTWNSISCWYEIEFIYIMNVNSENQKTLNKFHVLHKPQKTLDIRSPDIHEETEDRQTRFGDNDFSIHQCHESGTHSREHDRIYLVSAGIEWHVSCTTTTVECRTLRTFQSSDVWCGVDNWIVVYCKSINREIKKRCIYECRCDERLQTKTKEFTRLAYAGLVVELEHLKIETRLIDEKFTNEMGEYVT
jgi:hypothetical protein